MPSANVEVVRRGAEAWSRGDLDAMLREYATDVEIADPERVGAGPFRGHEALRQFIAEWLEAWDRYELSLDAIVDAGDAAVLFQRHRGRAKGSGIEVDHRGALLVRLRDGKIVFHRPYTHRAEALADAGVRPGEMWRATVERLLDGYAAWNDGDREGLIAMAGPNVELVPVRFAPLSFEPAGDRLLVEVDVDARSRTSGIELRERWAHVYALSEGRPVRLQGFTNSCEARRALAYPEGR